MRPTFIVEQYTCVRARGALAGEGTVNIGGAKIEFAVFERDGERNVAPRGVRTGRGYERTVDFDADLRDAILAALDGRAAEAYEREEANILAGLAKHFGFDVPVASGVAHLAARNAEARTGLALGRPRGGIAERGWPWWHSDGAHPRYRTIKARIARGLAAPRRGVAPLDPDEIDSMAATRAWTALRDRHERHGHKGARCGLQFHERWAERLAEREKEAKGV